MAVPFALSAHSFVNTVGAYAGVASIIGLAVLVLMYFVHARETSTLRERAAWLEEQVRVLEDRIAVLRRAPSSPQSPVPADAAGTGGAPPRQTGTAPGVRPTSALAGLAAPALRGAGPAQTAPVAPIGVGAPALASATHALRPAAPRPPASVPPAPVPAPVFATPGRAPAPAAPATAAPATAAGGARPPVPAPAVAAAAPAPARYGPEEFDDEDDEAFEPEPRFAEAGARRSPAPSARRPAAGRGAAPIPRGETAAGFAPGMTRYETSRRSGRAVLGVLAAVLVVAAVLIVLLVSGGGSSSNPAAVTVGSTTTPTTTKPRVTHRLAPTHFNPADVTVAVLNGTTTSGLAHRIAVILQTGGYKPGKTLTAPDQTRTATIVAFLPGQRDAALHVAQALKLGPSAVQPIDAATQAVACPSTAACPSQVVVTVGADLATAA